jgi:carboxyl-terminal processing protease
MFEQSLNLRDTMNKNNKRRVTTLLVVMLWFFSSAPVPARRQIPVDQPDRLVNEAWAAINKDYFDPNFGGADWVAVGQEFLNRNYATRAQAHVAIRRMLERLNSPATRFLTGEQVTAFLNEINGRAHVGAGLLELGVVDIDEQSRKLQIITTISNTPARRAGLQPRDLILAIDGIKTFGLGLTEAMEKLRGPEMTTVVLQIERSGKPLEVRLERQKIPAIEHSVRTELRPRRGRRLGYIGLDLFLESSVAQMRGAILDLERQRVSGLVLDLRNNPGGDLRACLQIAGLFLGEVPVVNIQGRDGVKPLRSIGEQITRLPLGVLVNQGTASASEILAAALQAAQRAVVVGHKTFGKGLAHKGAPLSDGSVVLLTSGSIQTLKGVEILGHGIAPDVTMNSRDGKDEQWNKAADLLLQGLTNPNSAVNKRSGGH